MDVGACDNDFGGMEMINSIPTTSGRPKKGIVYTLFVMAFLVSLSILVMVQGSNYWGGLVGDKVRSDEVGFFANGVRDDMGRGALIAGRKAVLSLVNNETDTGVFVAAANNSIAELLENGTLAGTPLDIMANSTVSAWTLALQKIANGRGIELNISINGLRVYPASAFDVMVASNTTIIVYDPLTKVKYNRTFLLTELVSIEDLEDPYVTIKSFAARRNTIRMCDYAKGVSPGSQWIYGNAYISKNNDCSGVSSRPSKILITDTMNGKAANCFDFAANVTEDDSASGTNYLRNASRAYSAAKNDTYVVLSNNALWLTNSTSCYFEAPSGPSFLDRLEGRGTMSAKYDASNAIEGIGAFLYVPPEYKLDYLYYA